MKNHRRQQGSVLVLSLIILLVMTVLGVSAMTDSGLQERMVGNQKRTIEAALAAESGAVTAMQWLQAHPEQWGDLQAWKSEAQLPAELPHVPNFIDNSVYWIESIRFVGDTATIVSRGGILVADKIFAQSTLIVILQRGYDKLDLVVNADGAGKITHDDNKGFSSQQGMSSDTSTITGTTSVAGQPTGIVAENSRDRNRKVGSDSAAFLARMKTRIIAWRPSTAISSTKNDSE